uniref:Polyprotein n=1 Tax=Little cherry virus 2 TaxID=154339 RepID=A0A679GE29_9CLOS|nr:polyprotein [Little cherry virus 2]
MAQTFQKNDLVSCLNLETMYGELLKQVTSRINFKENSDLFLHVDSSLKTLLKEKEDVLSHKFQCSISANIDQDARSTLDSAFPELQIKYTTSSRSEHPMCYCVRMAFNALFHCYGAVGESIDVGGCPQAHRKAGHSNVHTCNPTLSGKDVSRRVADLSDSLKILHSSNVERTTSVGESACSVSSCSNRFEECDHPAFSAYMVDVYDVSLLSLVDGMDKHKTVFTNVALILPAELIEESGEVDIQSLNTVVRWDYSTVTYFIGNTGDSYMHCRQTLVQYLTTNRIVSSLGKTYDVCYEGDRLGYKYFRVLRSSSSLASPSTLRRYDSTLHGMYFCNLPVPTAFGFEVKDMYLDGDFVERVQSYLLNVAAGVNERTFEYTVTNIRSQKTHLIVGSRTVHSKVEIDSTYLPILAAVLLTDSVRKRNQALGATRDFLSERGSLVGMFHMVGRRFTNTIGKKIYGAKLNFLKHFDPQVYKVYMAMESPLKKVETKIDVPLKTISGGDKNDVGLILQRETLEATNLTSGKALENLSKSMVDYLKTNSPEKLSDLIKLGFADVLSLNDLAKAFLEGAVEKAKEGKEPNVLGDVSSNLIQPNEAGKEIIKEVAMNRKTEFKPTVIDSLTSENEVNQVKEVSKTFFNSLLCAVKGDFGMRCATFPVGGRKDNHKAINAIEFVTVNSSERRVSNWDNYVPNLGRKRTVPTNWSGYECTWEITQDSMVKRLVVGEKRQVGLKDEVITILGNDEVQKKEKEIVSEDIKKKEKVSEDPPKQSAGFSEEEKDDIISTFLGEVEQVVPSGPLEYDAEAVFKGLQSLELNKKWIKGKKKMDERQVVGPSEICGKEEADTVTSDAVIDGFLENMLLDNDVQPLPKPPVGSVSQDSLKFEKTSEDNMVIAGKLVGSVPNLDLNKFTSLKLRGRDAWFFSKTGDAYGHDKVSYVVLPWVEQLDKLVNCFGDFNTALVQRYTLGGYVSWHADDEPCYSHDDSIVTINFNGPATFSIRSGNIYRNFNLLDRSVLIMKAGLQKVAKHMVKSDFEGRVSITLRKQLRPCVLTSKGFMGLSSRPNSPDEESKDNDSARKQSSGRDGPTTGSRPNVQKIAGGATLPSNAVVTGHNSKCSDEDLTRAPSISSDNCGKVNGEDDSVVDNLKGYAAGDLPSVVIESEAIDKNTLVSVMRSFLPPGCEWMLSERPWEAINESSVCPPHCLPDRLRDNCSAEYVLLLANVCFKMYERYRKVYNNRNILLKGGAFPAGIKTLFKDLCVFNKHRVAVHIDGESELITHAFMVFSLSSGKFVRTEDIAESLDQNGLFCVDSELFKGIQFRLLANSMKLGKFYDFEERFSKSTIVLEDTPPGGGKTTNMLTRFRSNPFRTCILTANLESSLDINRQLNAERRTEGVRYARTIDSRVMNSLRAGKCDTVCIDECFLVHAGELKICTVLAGADEVYLYGDSQQIPFINRLQCFVCRNSVIRTDNFKVIKRNVSYRCPSDVCIMLSEKKDKRGNLCYPAGVKKGNSSRPDRSVSYKAISSVTDVDMENGDVFITFTQDEKHAVNNEAKARKLKVSTNTVHEIQGKTVPFVKIVRLKAADDSVFTMTGHEIVALSRHTVGARYYSISKRLFEGVGREIRTMMTLGSLCSRVFNMSSVPNIYSSLPKGLVRDATPISRAPKAHLEALNYFLDDCVRGTTSLEFRHLNECQEFSDFSSIVDNVIIRDCEGTLKVDRGDVVVPVIRSSIGSKKLNRLKQNLITYEARNFISDAGADRLCSDVTAGRMVDNFFNNYIDSDKLSLEVSDQITFNKRSVGEWLDKRDGRRFNNVMKDLTTQIIPENDLTSFKLMLKTDSKPKLDDSVLSSVPSGQNIVYHRGSVNALFSHIFCQTVERLHRVLKRNFLLATGMSQDEFEMYLNDGLNNKVQDLFCSEVDISKFDKSQGPLIKQIEEMVLRRLGVDSEVLDWWYSSEYESVCSSFDKSLTVSVDAQRRTGGSNTWLGNTIVNMVLLAYVKEFDPNTFVCFSGDDSLVLSRDPIYFDFFKLSLELGFDVKFTPVATPYFCSKYLINTEDRIYIVPDIFKLVTKLGRVFARTKAEGLETFESFKDSIKWFGRDDVVGLLAYYHQEKYGPSKHVYDAACAIHCIGANFDQYSRLAYKKTNVAFGFEFI